MTQPKQQPVFAEDAFAADDELQERLAATRAEYGTYEAVGRIYAGNALAFAPGHPVPVSTVLAQGYWLNGQVQLQDGAEHPPQMLAIIEPPPAQEPAPDPDGTSRVDGPDEDGDK